MFISKKQTRDFIQEESKNAGGNHILFKAMTRFQIKEPVNNIHQLGELCISPTPTHTYILRVNLPRCTLYFQIGALQNV